MAGSKDNNGQMWNDCDSFHLRNPSGITVSNNGTLFIADTGCKRLVKKKKLQPMLWFRADHDGCTVFYKVLQNHR